MSESVEYFAYGSNLNKEQMKERGIVIKDTAIAELPGWRLAFTIYSNTWNGGVGDIIPDPKKKVEGIVYTISYDNLKSLDIYEGRKVEDDMEVGMYRRQYLPVKKADGWKTVLTYLVNRPIEHKSTADCKPSKDYLETIISGAEEHGLSEGYLKWLKNIDYEN
ncbi:MAG: gamma-glutamylcyclotransferase family protein [Candidatus Natronoplasma sp.]